MSRPTDAAITDRDHALNWLVGAVPYIRFLGIRFDREGDQITAHLPFQPMLIGASGWHITEAPLAVSIRAEIAPPCKTPVAGSPTSRSS